MGCTSGRALLVAHQFAAVYHRGAIWVRGVGTDLRSRVRTPDRATGRPRTFGGRPPDTANGARASRSDRKSEPDVRRNRCDAFQLRPSADGPATHLRRLARSLLRVGPEAPSIRSATRRRLSSGPGGAMDGSERLCSRLGIETRDGERLQVALSKQDWGQASRLLRTALLHHAVVGADPQRDARVRELRSRLLLLRWSIRAGLWEECVHDSVRAYELLLVLDLGGCSARVARYRARRGPARARLGAPVPWLDRERPLALPRSRRGDGRRLRPEARDRLPRGGPGSRGRSFPRGSLPEGCGGRPLFCAVRWAWLATAPRNLVDR